MYAHATVYTAVEVFYGLLLIFAFFWCILIHSWYALCRLLKILICYFFLQWQIWMISQTRTIKLFMYYSKFSRLTFYSQCCWSLFVSLTFFVFAFNKSLQSCKGEKRQKNYKKVNNVKLWFILQCSMSVHVSLDLQWRGRHR